MQVGLLLVLLLTVQATALSVNSALNELIIDAMGRDSSGIDPEAVQELYVMYMREFSRRSKSNAMDNIRFKAFNRTVDGIIRFVQSGGDKNQLALNEFSDWTDEERSVLLGARMPKEPINETNAKPGQRILTWSGQKSTGKASLPSSYDLTQMVVQGTKVPVVLGVKNQASCGSCYAFATIALLEFQYAVQIKASKALSEQQIVDCSDENYGCGGGWFTKAFSYLQSNRYQVDSSVSYPYKAVAGRCSFKGSGGGGVKFGSLIYRKIAVNNAVGIQEALVNYGPLYVSFFAGDPSTATYRWIQNQFYSYSSGIWRPSGCPTSSANTNHAVVIVGYGVDSKTGVAYWKVRNSWGTGWGERGYFKIQRGVNMCGIESGAYYIARAS